MCSCMRAEQLQWLASQTQYYSPHTLVCVLKHYVIMWLRMSQRNVYNILDVFHSKRGGIQSTQCLYTSWLQLWSNGTNNSDPISRQNYISSFRTFVNLTRLSVTILCSYTIIVCWRAPLAIQHIQAYTNQGPSNYNSRYVCVHANGSLLVASIESVVALL